MASESIPGDCGLHHVKRRRYPGPTTSCPNSKLTSRHLFHVTRSQTVPYRVPQLYDPLLVHILRAIPQYHALICLGIPLFDTFPLPSPVDGALEAAPPPTSFASSDRHPDIGVQGHQSLCGSIRFDRLATNVAALHFSLAGQFLHTSRLARPNCP